MSNIFVDPVSKIPLSDLEITVVKNLYEKSQDEGSFGGNLENYVKCVYFGQSEDGSLYPNLGSKESINDQKEKHLDNLLQNLKTEFPNIPDIKNVQVDQNGTPFLESNIYKKKEEKLNYQLDRNGIPVLETNIYKKKKKKKERSIILNQKLNQN